MNADKCAHCGRDLVPGRRWTETLKRRDGGRVHANCLGAMATQDLIERVVAAMHFAGVFGPWRLVGDLYEPGEAWRPLSVQFDTHYGPITVQPRTSVVEVQWQFFEGPLTRTDQPMVLTWPPGLICDDFTSFTQLADPRAHCGWVHVPKPGQGLGSVFARLLDAASKCLQADSRAAEPPKASAP